MTGACRRVSEINLEVVLMLSCCSMAMAAACSVQGTVHGQALAGNAWWGSEKLFGLVQATGKAVGFAAPQTLRVLAVKLLFAPRVPRAAASLPAPMAQDAVAQGQDRARSRECCPDCLPGDREGTMRAGATSRQGDRQMPSRCLIIGTAFSDP